MDDGTEYLVYRRFLALMASGGLGTLVTYGVFALVVFLVSDVGGGDLVTSVGLGGLSMLLMIPLMVFVGGKIRDRMMPKDNTV
jgi:hypothetical protein